MKYNDSNIEQAVNSKYNHYQNHFLNKKITYDGLPIIPKRYPKYDNKCGTFFHMITKEKETVPCHKNPCPSDPCSYHFQYNPLINLEKEPRHICPHRLSCLNLSGFFNRQLLIWEKELSKPKGKKERILCYDPKNRYLVILDKNKNNSYVTLWTGYPIVYQWKHNKLLNEYKNYIVKTKKQHQTSMN